MPKKVIEFLRESNAIERVYDEASLTHAKYAWEYIIEQEELTVHDVLHTHKILMLNQRLLPNEKGAFRRCAVYIGGRKGINHNRIPKKIEEWVYEMNNIYTGVALGSIEDRSKFLHVLYEKIHPFVDGNGRTGRIFMNWWRLRNNLPILVIHEGEEQTEYYKWFK